MNIIPVRISRRSRAFAFRFLSLKMITPQKNDTRTELRLISDTTEIMESSSFSADRYEKSAADMNIEISGIAQLQWNGVDLARCGYHRMATITAIIAIW